jgi:hypothetical protein
MTTIERRRLAATAGIEAWLNAASPSRAVIDAFDDEGLRATEAEISIGLEAAREFQRDGATRDAVIARVLARAAAPVVRSVADGDWSDPAIWKRE